MSTQNITNVVPAGPETIVVTFRTKSGDERSYEYRGAAAFQILFGADPKNYAGTRVPTRYGRGIFDLAELAELMARVLKLI